MNINWIQNFVQETRSKIVEQTDGDTYKEFVYRQGLPAIRLAFGLVVLNESDESKSWFSALAPLWSEGAAVKKEVEFEEGNTHASVLPVRSWFRSLSSAVMSQDTEMQIQTAEDVYRQITNPEHHELEGRERQARMDSYAGLAALLLGKDLSPHLAAIREHASRHSEDRYPYVWEARPYNIPQAKILEGINEVNTQMLTEGLQELNAFHEEYQVGNTDVHRMEREIDFHTTTYVVLARQHGLDVHVDSEYIPDTVYDDEHYPLGRPDA